jgi:hypothetical protein
MVNTPRVLAAPLDFRTAQNNSGSTLTKGTVVKLKTTGTDDVIIATAITDFHFGVVTADIADGGVGTVQIRGRCAVRVGTGGITCGDKLTHDTAGYGRVAAAAPATGVNNAIIGVATRTLATVDGLVEAEIGSPSMMQGA